MKFRSFGLSDKGKTRNTNQDSFLINEPERLFLVADGLGGHVSGDIASKMAVKDFEECILKFRNGETPLSFNKRDDLTIEQNRMLAAAICCNKKIIAHGKKTHH